MEMAVWKTRQEVILMMTMVMIIDLDDVHGYADDHDAGDGDSWVDDQAGGDPDDYHSFAGDYVAGDSDGGYDDNGDGDDSPSILRC